MIYLDHAATTLPKPPEVIQAVTAAMASFGNASRGAHPYAMQAARTIYDTRVKLAKLFHAPCPERIAFTANATEALNLAICGAIPPGGHIITTDLEHNSVLRPLYRLQSEGQATLSFIPADAAGNIDPMAMQQLIRPDTRAIVCTHASNLTGNMVDLGKIGQIAREHNILLIVDAAQTAGAQPIDMQAMHIGILCFTGHKALMGPQGTGGLCLAKHVDVRPWKVGGSGFHSFAHEQPDQYPERLEAGTLNAHGIAGLSAALDILDAYGIKTLAAAEARLLHRFREGVASIPGITVYGDFSKPCRAPIVALNIRDEDSAVVADELAVTYGIATRAGAHCAPHMHTALGTQAQGAVRFSFSWQNTEAEVDAAVDALRSIAL